MRDSRLRTLFIIVFIDLLGFSLILPLLAFYASAYGATPAVVGLLVASYAAAQLIGAPILGRLSDRHGRRPILLLSVFGTLLGFLMLGLAEPIGAALAGLFSGLGLAVSLEAAVIGVLFASRILDGLTGGNITVAQAYIADITDNQGRARALGFLGAAFGLGFIIGPAVGGTLSIYGYSVPAFAAAAMSLIALLSIYFALPESLPEEERRARAQAPRSAFTVAALTEAFRLPRVSPLLVTRFLFGLSFAMMQTIFPLYGQQRFGLTAQTTGYILTYIGIIIVLVQGVGIGVMTARWRESRLIVFMIGLFGLAVLAWALVPSVAWLLVAFLPLAIAGGSLNTLISSVLSKSVYPEEIGGILGLSTSVESLTRVIAPVLGGYLLGSVGSAAPGVASALLMAVLFPYAYFRLIARPAPPLAERTPEGASELAQHTQA
ncbi:MAG: MFS transporter [Anaerolineales bacterium]|nr:MFS transporter [Anaerolineales bacterium]